VKFELISEQGITIRALAVCVLASIPFVSLLAAERRVHRLSFGGFEREYILSTPVSRRPRPTVLVLHGSLLNAQVTVQSMGFEPLVDRESLVAVYPNAVSGQWNDGRPVAAGWTGGRVDDVAFIHRLIGHLVSTGVSDPKRIYVAGYSNGGMMALRLMCEAPELIAAGAGIGTSFPVELAQSCKAPGPTPMLLMNGTADLLVPYGGGQLAFGGGRVLSTNATLRLLRKINGCTGSAKVNRLPDVDRYDGSNVVITSWTNCASAAPVVLYRIEGGGHRIPSRSEGVPFVDTLLGRLNHDFDAADAMWSFFKGRTR
jgi:polyhydroxybutyrate depolymerase